MKHFSYFARSSIKDALSHREIENLIGRAKNGDVRAFTKVYDRLVDHVYRFVYVRLNDAADAQDVTAETWKTVWLKLNQYKRGNFRGYVFRIAYTNLIDFVRKKKAHQSLDATVQLPAKNLALDTHVIKKEEYQKLHKALAQLPKQHALIVTMRFLDELSIREVAHVLGISSIMVRVTQHRALKKLKQILSND